jgi:hypothetical protein
LGVRSVAKRHPDQATAGQVSQHGVVLLVPVPAFLETNQLVALGGEKHKSKKEIQRTVFLFK